MRYNQLLDDMHEDGYRPHTIMLVLGDNDMTFNSGAPRKDMRMDTFPSAFHQRRAVVVALSVTVGPNVRQEKKLKLSEEM